MKNGWMPSKYQLNEFTLFISICILQDREAVIKQMRIFITKFLMFHCFVNCSVKGDKIPL